MGKKYAFTGETIKFQSKLLYQIVAVKDIEANGVSIKAGTTGGYIENDCNLSHEDGCWLEERSFILEDSIVSGDIQVRGSSIISRGCDLEGTGIVEDAKLKDVTLNGIDVFLKKLKLKNSTIYGKVEINQGAIENCEIIHSGGLGLKFLNCEIINPISGTRLLIQNEDEKELRIKDAQIHFTERKHAFRNIQAYGKIEGFIGKEMNDIDLRGFLFLSHVHAEKCSIVTNRSNQFISIRGSKEAPVKIQHGRVFMRDVAIDGRGILIDGVISLTSVEMYHYASVKNVLDEALDVMDTKIQDCSSILKENYNDELVKMLNLQNDDVYVVQRMQ